MQVILDISANTHKNDIRYYMKMMRELRAIDNGKHEIIIKGQLFIKAGDNIPQSLKMFNQMMSNSDPHKVTASVFELQNLQWLLHWYANDIPFIKIANNRALDWLIGEIPRKIHVYRSVGTPDECIWDKGITNIACVSKYPATIDEYKKEWNCADTLSDHTVGLELIKHYKPKIYECHFVLEHGQNNLDGGPWAKTPEQLREILEL
jgi:hypothetical protein